MSKKELSQKQAGRISEIEGKLEGLRVLVTGLVSWMVWGSVILMIRKLSHCLTVTRTEFMSLNCEPYPQTWFNKFGALRSYVKQLCQNLEQQFI